MSDSLIKVERNEKKFLLSEFQAAKLRFKLLKTLPLDLYSGDCNEGYVVRSLYFDTLGDNDFYDKEEGLERRRKIRLRCYPPDFEHLKLELKEKRGDFQSKRSILLSRSEAELMASGDFGFLQDKGDLATQLYIVMVSEAYIPRCVVEYNRLAFCVSENDTRLTIDSRLCVSEDTGVFFEPFAAFYPAINWDMVTLEVKYQDFLLQYIKELIANYSKIQTSVSKYYAARGIGHSITM